MGKSDRRVVLQLPRHTRHRPVKQADSPVFKLEPAPRPAAACHDNTALTDEYRIKNAKAPAIISTASRQGTGEDGPRRRALLQRLPAASTTSSAASTRPRTPNHAKHRHDLRQMPRRIEEPTSECARPAAAEGRPPRARSAPTPQRGTTSRKPATATSKGLSDQSCGKCHQDRLEHYRETYHGKAMALASPMSPPTSPLATTAMATRRSFRGPTRVRGLSKPEHRRHLPAMPPGGETPSSTEYQPHANPLRQGQLPALNKVFLFMTALRHRLSSASSAAHAVLALPLDLRLYLHDSKSFRGPSSRRMWDDETFTRFTPFAAHCFTS